MTDNQNTGKILKYPENFLWGTATSAYQIEGGIKYNDWAQTMPAGRACDHYNLWREDLSLLQRLNQNAYRFSVEWSRIEITPGFYEQKEIEHYREMLKDLKEKKITTFLTLHHFTNPAWLAKAGGWLNDKVVFYFGRFADKMFSELGEVVDFWITINEPIIYACESYLWGNWPPNKKNIFSVLQVINNQIKAHNKAYRTLHRRSKFVKIGIAKNNVFYEPYDSQSSLDKMGADVARYLRNQFFLNQIKYETDFIGLNYYFHEKIKFPLTRQNENKIVSDAGTEIYPEGIYHVLQDLKKYELPIYITENGVADAKDNLRNDFIQNHLIWIHKATEEGVPVKGYLYWSLLDNFDWEKGFGPKFGLAEVDYQTMERKLRPSADFYAKICKENQLTLGE